MAEEYDFTARLVDALSAKSNQLERSAMPKLREHLQGFEASVSAMYKFLIDKGFMQNDPYKHEHTVTEIEVPSSDPFTDTEASTEVSLRFSHYVSQWEFMVNIFHVSLSNFSLRKVKRLLELLDWIRWTDFSPNSSFQITRAVAGIVTKVSNMKDPMAGKIMSSSVTHLRDLSNDIKGLLKTITVFLRERYKWRLRDEVLSRMAINPEQYRRSPWDIVDNVKFEFSVSMKDAGWYKELVLEALEEDYGEDSENKRAAVLERLRVTQTEQKKKKKSGPDDRIALYQIIEKMAKGGEPMRTAIMKMNENSRTLQERKRSFGERLSEIVSSLFHRTGGNIVYDIAIRNSATGAVRYESLDFTVFSDKTAKRARALQELQDPHSNAHKNVRTASPEKLLDYIEKILAEMKTIHKRLEGLDNFFRSNAVPEIVKNSMKPISLPLKNLKAAISETMSEKNSFIAKKEEEAQLKKLGIED